MQTGASTTWNVGDVILDLYKVTDILGEGGFGTVYKVRHQGWNIDLAVKSPKPEIVAAAGGVENFEREAETWVNLGLHPHTVSCYYVRRIESSPLVFAEYVAGGSLQDWIGDRRLYAGGSATSLKRILDIAIQFAWGLHYAHEQGLVHQDVKPANVILTPDGVVKVTDFGLAKGRTLADKLDPSLFEKGKEEAYTLMTEGSGAMTPAYCSPEQAKRKTLTRRSDLWSWGLCLLEMFQGERSWQAGIIADQALEFYWKTWRPDSQLPQMPARVARLLQRCFRDNPNERPRNMLAVVNELQGMYQQVTGEAYPREEPRAGIETADTLNNRAVSLLDLGKQEEALQLWEQALKMHPQHPESTYNRGVILRRVGRIDDVALVREMEQMRQSNPENWVADYLLGLVHLELDDWEAALKMLRAIQEAKAEQKKPVKRALQPEIQRYQRYQGLLRTLTGHTQSVRSVCLSTDSRFALSGSSDCTLKLWEVTTGRCLRTFEGHTDAVNSVCLSADSQFALSGSSDCTLKLWEVSTGRCLHTFEGHRWVISAVYMSRDNRFALSGTYDGTLKLWEISTGRCLRTFIDEHALDINSVYLDRDSRLALSGTDDGTLKVWEVATGKCLSIFKGHTDSVSSVCLSGDCRFALSGSSDRTLKLWEVATDLCLHNFRGHTDIVNSVYLSADSRFVLSGGDDRTLKLWIVNVAEERNRYSVPIMLSQVQATEDFLAISLNYERELEKARAALERGDYEAATQHLEKAQSQPGYDHHEKMLNAQALLYALSYERELEKARTALERGDSVAAIQHLEKVQSQPGYKQHQEVPNALTLLYGLIYKHELKQVQAALERGDYLAAAKHLEKAKSQPGHSNYEKVVNAWTQLYALIYGQELEQARAALVRGDYLAAFQHLQLARSQPGYRQYEKVVNAWIQLHARKARSQWGYSHHNQVVSDWELLYMFLPRKKFLSAWEDVTLTGHTGGVSSVCLSRDCRFALSGSYDNTIKLWELTTGRCLRTFQRDQRNRSSSMDNEKNRSLLEHRRSVYSVYLSADDRFALSGHWNKTLKLWEVATGRCLRTFEGHTDIVSSVCLSENGRFALSGSHDGTLKLWEVTRGQCLRTFEGHTGGVSSVCLSADGRFALSGHWNKTLKLWELATSQCLRIFEGHTREVDSVSLSGDGRFALSSSYDGTLKLWEVATGQCLRTFKGHGGTVCLSADGRFALSGHWNKTLKLWEVATGRCLRTFEGHTGIVSSVCLSENGLFALSGSYDKTLKLWVLNWELEERQPADWDERARPYLENFITRHTPYAATLPKDREPSEAEITLALTRRGTPTWTEEDFQKLLYTLGCAGYGWLRPEGVRKQLEAMAKN